MEITLQENVIRNNLAIDEGDPFNKILQNKSINNLKSLNFFKSVSADVLDGSNPNSKVINIKVEEKPTGEISTKKGSRCWDFRRNFLIWN